jgi:hypothetical protein
MPDENEFVQADAEAAGEVIVESPQKETTAVGPVTSRNIMPADVVEFRKQLLEEYHKGASGLIERINRGGMGGFEPVVVELINEMVRETDHLLGNELVATQNGDLRDASIISFKRVESLEKTLKSIHEKREKEKTHGGIDIDSPAMLVIFRFFMSKAKDTFDRMGVSAEITDLFFRQLPEVMGEWKKELKENLEHRKQ